MNLEKQFKQYETKNISLDVKDVDTQTRRVKVALAAFDNVDSDGDVIRKGAFAKSIQERGADSTGNRKIAMLRYHDWEHQIGKILTLEETDYHLLATVEMGRSSKGEDAFLDYQDGIIIEHSIGFNYIQDKMQLIGEGEQAYWDIKEVFLWEGSAVTFGANSLTPTLDVSKGNQKEVIEAINKQMTGFISALKNGKGTDERLYSIEMGLKVCQEKYNSLLISQPFKKNTDKEQPNEEESELLKSEQNKKSLSNFYLKQ